MTPREFLKARHQLGLTQEQAARMLGYRNRSRISEIENGKTNPSTSVTLLLQAYLDGYRPKHWPAPRRPA